MSRKNRLKAVTPQAPTLDRLPKRIPVPPQPTLDLNRHFVLSEAQLQGVIRTYASLPAAFSQQKLALQTFLELPSTAEFLREVLVQVRAGDGNEKSPTPAPIALEHSNGNAAKAGA